MPDLPLLRAIRDRSHTVDETFRKLKDDGLRDFEIEYPVPSFHPRARTLPTYRLHCGRFGRPSTEATDAPQVLLTCEAVRNSKCVTEALRNWSPRLIVLPSKEAEIKTRLFMDRLAETWISGQDDKPKAVTVAGGGLLLNVGAFVAELTDAKLFLYPTTVLAMADGAGGKVRLNHVAGGQAIKHHYKSFYEPNEIILETEFLGILPEREVRCGLVEIVKHGLFQSGQLLDFLRNSGEALLTSSTVLLRAILWAAALKNVCLAVDVEENENGSRRILRAGHGFSDKLEETFGFAIPHGFAVAIGICTELEAEENTQLLHVAREVFSDLRIPTTVRELEQYGWNQK